MSRAKKSFVIIGSILAVCILVFALGLAELGWKAYFKPKHENIERRVFESTKSYTHGMTQELAKHYGEYQKADPEEKMALKNIIKTRFADFDESKIRTATLKSFLIRMRGY